MNTAEKYCYDIIKGNIPACRWVKKACERHVYDLETQDERGLKFDPACGQDAINFFTLLKHYKGEWAGSTIALEPWQQFITYALFGWTIAETGYRRFKTAYIEVARKNGKTTWAAGIALFMLWADLEPGAEVYSSATTRDQSKIVFEAAQHMVKMSDSLNNKIDSFKNNLSIISTASKFEPLSSDYNTLDGLNIHAAIADELHAWPKRDLWDVVETATGARRQPLQLAITTAGYDRNGICYEQHEYVEKLLNKTIEDDSYFGIIYTIDEKDNWKDEKNWIKANPNLGVSVKVDDLQRKCLKASQLPAAQNNFMRKHLDVWTQQSERWIDLDMWEANNLHEIYEEEYAGRVCYGGLDLSSVKDFTAWVMLFVDQEDPEKLDILARFWCPEDRLYAKDNKYRDQYQAWHKEGFLEVTSGNSIDYRFIKDQILHDASMFKLDSMNIDRLFQGYSMMTELIDEGITVFPLGMGWASMAIPMKEFERRLLKNKLNHGGNPIMRFCADNIAVSIDKAGNMSPNKATSQGKIDGIVATLLALDRVIRTSKKSSGNDGSLI